MKHSGMARKAAFRIIFLSLVAVVLIWALGLLVTVISTVLGIVGFAGLPFLLAAWLIFGAFTLYFFRDPTPKIPVGTNLILSPAHGKVDVIDTTTEPRYLGGPCQRISIFLSVFNVHVQNAPVTGKLAFYQYTEGQFLNALKTESAQHNENVLLGFEASEPRDLKLGVRLIAGVIARRIVPFVKQGDDVVKGDRIALIQFGSRADVYLPEGAKISVKLGDHVVGGQTVLATFD